MLRHLFHSKKMRRKEANAKAILPIYGIAATTLPADYLTRHQEADAATKNRVLLAASERRQRRALKRLAAR